MNNLYAIWNKDDNTIYGEYTIQELLKKTDLPANVDFIPNYNNYESTKDIELHRLRDKNDTLVKEYDIIFLNCDDPELWTSGFQCSNCGKGILEKGDISGFYISLTSAGNSYRAYYKHKDGYIHRTGDGEIENSYAMDGNTSFIQYLTIKGAVVVDNLLRNPDFFIKLQQPLFEHKSCIDLGDMFITTMYEHAYLYDKATEKRLADFIVRRGGDIEGFWEGRKYSWIAFYKKENAMPYNEEMQREYHFDNVDREFLVNLFNEIYPILNDEKYKRIGF